MLKVPLFKRRLSTVVVISIFTLIIIYALAVQNLIPGVEKLVGPIMRMTGKDMTFSARSIIWDVIKQHIQVSPWLGTGYAAFWIEAPSSPSYVFVQMMYFYPMSSHNGYLDIANDLGRAGLLCLISFLVIYLRQALRLMQFDRSQATLYLAVLFHQMVDNLAESVWFATSVNSAIVLLASFCLSRALLDRRANVLP